MKRLPESELEIMMIIWQFGGAVNRMDIEKHLEKKVAAPTILSFLNRLEKKGFVKVEKEGKINRYTPLIRKEDYLQEESKSILQRMYQNSIKNFMTALYDGEGLSDRELQELKDFIEEKSSSREEK